MKAYIQQINGQFPDDWIYNAYLGFGKLGMEICMFEDIKQVPKHKDNIVVGFVEDTIKHFHKWSMCPTPLNIHPSIEKHCGRKMKVVTMGELRNSIGDLLPLFIKPYSQIKSFDSGVITKISSLGFFDHLPPSTQVFTSEVINILSEYRCFVYRGELVGIQWYAGDFKLFPYISVIEGAIKDFNATNITVPTTQAPQPPIAYTMDFAIVENRKSTLFSNETLLIECNDAWSIGNYGLESKIYAKMLRDRWREIFKDYE